MGMYSATPAAISPFVEQTESMLSLLEELVMCESPSSDIAATNAALELVLPHVEKAFGRSAELVECGGRNHLVLRATTPGKAAVLLVGHMDTVWPNGTTARWPFSISDGVITGPGCFDMKAGIVQLLAAVASLDPASSAALSLVITSDEEIGSPSSRVLIEELARNANAALVLEPSQDGALKTARKGVSNYRVDVTGRASHAGLEPEKGANAVLGLAHVLLAIPGIARPKIGTTVTPTVAAAGTTTNTVPAAALVHVDVRALSEQEQSRVDAEIRLLTSPVEDTVVSFEGGPNRPPLDASASDRLFAQARRIAGELGLETLEGVGVGGGSDGNFTAGVGTETLDGLGAVGGKAHAEGEWVRVEAMAQRAALVARVIEELVAEAV